MTMNLSGSFFPVYKADNISFSPDTFACAERTVEKLLAARTTSEYPGMLLGKVHRMLMRTAPSWLVIPVAHQGLSQSIDGQE